MHEEIEDEEPKVEEDGLVLLYNALNKQLIALSQQIEDADIKLSDKDDKTFDRLMKAMVESRSIAENLQWLKIQLGIGKESESAATEKKSINPIEARAKKKF